MCEVFPRVFLGDRFTSKDASFVLRNGITHILNCTKKLPNIFENVTSLRMGKNNSGSTSVLNDIVNDFEEDSDIMMNVSKSPLTPISVPRPPLPSSQDETKTKIKKIQYFRMSVDDSRDTILFDPQDEEKSVLLAGVRFMENALRDTNSKILVHCFEGRSRSVTVLIGYGMKSLRKTLESSYSTLVYQVLQRGHDISMNESFQMQLMKLERKIYPALQSNSLNFIPEREREDDGFFEDMDDDENNNEEDESYEPKRKKRKMNNNNSPTRNRFLTAHEIYQSIKERVNKEKEKLGKLKFKQRNIMTMFKEQNEKIKKMTTLEYRKKKDIENLQINASSMKQKSIGEFFVKKKRKKKKKKKNKNRTGNKRRRK